MSEVVIYENPGNKAARLERENHALKRENRELRTRLGDITGQEVLSAVTSQAPALPQAQTFTHGACAVTIGAKPGRKTASAIPSLAQDAAAPVAQDASGTQVEIYNAAEGVPQQAQAAKVAISRPPVARKMVAGAPAPGGAVFDLAQIRPTPIKPRVPEEDQASERFALMELDEQTVKATGK